METLNVVQQGCKKVQSTFIWGTRGGLGVCCPFLPLCCISGGLSHVNGQLNYDAVVCELPQLNHLECHIHINKDLQT